MNSNKLLICLTNLIEDTKVILNKDIEQKTKKEEKQKILNEVESSIHKIDQDYKKLQSLSKKNNVNKKKLASQLSDIHMEISELKEVYNEQKEKIKNFVEKKALPRMTNRQTKISMFTGKKMMLSPQLRQMYYKETKNIQEGVNTAYEIKDKIHDINATLDEVTDMVRLQKYKLLSISSQIKESQSIMKRSQKIIRSFSKELYKDKIIKFLLGFITLVLILIMVSAVMYKIKSAELIGHEIDNHKKLSPDVSEIDENYFWKTIYESNTVQNENSSVDAKLKEQSKMLSGGIDLMKLSTLRKKLKEINEEIESKNNSLTFI